MKREGACALVLVMDGLSVYFTKEWLTCSDEPPSHYTVLMAASLWILSSLTAIHYSPKPGRVATTFGGIFHLLFEVGVNGTSFIACEMIAVDRRNTFYIYILLFISPTCTQTNIYAYVYNVCICISTKDLSVYWYLNKAQHFTKLSYTFLVK